MDLRIAPNRDELGRDAARDIANALRERLQSQPHLRMIFAAAPSQREMLDALIQEPGIDWSTFAFRRGHLPLHSITMK